MSLQREIYLPNFPPAGNLPSKFPGVNLQSDILLMLCYHVVDGDGDDVDVDTDADAGADADCAARFYFRHSDTLLFFLRIGCVHSAVQ